MSCTQAATRTTASRPERGSAALEVLLLMPFILLILMLLFNMGYNGDRKRDAQAALRMGAFLYVSGLTTQNAQKAEQQAEGAVNSQLFAGESNAADLYFSTGQSKPADLKGFQDDQGLLGNVSSRITAGVDVKRDPPYVDLVDRSAIRTQITLSSNTWTFCEMQDEDLPGGAPALDTINLVGDYALWLFGGCGGGLTSKNCGSKCQ